MDVAGCANVEQEDVPVLEVAQNAQAYNQSNRQYQATFARERFTYGLLCIAPLGLLASGLVLLVQTAQQQRRTPCYECHKQKEQERGPAASHAVEGNAASKEHCPLPALCEAPHYVICN